ncbi:hypothetical protein [Rhizobium sp. YS-1r]|uniref:tetratricopeptide repeat protein n=1 Tax=Rhizobium sp. YS-1r TaxID=1532558 RepID=UPI00050DEC7B|nr:hypothetical protein [Rhizobium sp. YS-1r]KGE02284.1 hypothetical protein JL39_01755 [Rhizobium sp. YS-1r]
MGAEEHDTGTSEVSEPEARTELTRLSSDERFHATGRQKAILIYLSERKFAGCEEGTKAFAIAVDVLGRTSSFESSVDPIVRIEMSRLRSALENYYEAFGHEAAVWIEIPRGRYVTLFTRSRLSIVDSSGGGNHDIGEPPVEPIGACPKTAPRGIPRRSRFWPVVVSAAAIVCVTAGVSAGTWLYSRPVLTQPPTVGVAVGALDPELDGEASLTRDMLLTALTQFQTLTVSAEPIGPHASKTDYHVEIRYYADGEDRNVWWQIVEGKSGHLLKAGVENVKANGKSPAAMREDVAATLSGKLAATKGVITLLELRKTSDSALGNVCVLHAEGALEDGDARKIGRAAKCLERTLKLDPKHADAAAALSEITALNADEHSTARAVQLAEDAVAVDPLSDRVQMAMARAQVAAGKTDGALISANRALALNPHNPDVAATLASVLFSAGYWDAANDMAADAGRSPDLVPREAILVKALDAYRRGDWSDASLLAEQVTGGGVAGMLKAAALGQLGSPEAAQRLSEVRAEFPDFESTFRARMVAHRYRPDLVASIEDGLRKAGARFRLKTLATAYARED